MPILASIVVVAGQALSQAASPPVVSVHHLEPTIQYDRLARQARIQGTILLKLTIEENGTVSNVVGTVVDRRFKGQDLLRDRAEALVRRWTFKCHNCAPAASFQHEMKFTYRLLEEEREDPDTTIVMNLPDEVLITAYSPVCDHCLPPKSSSKRAH